MAINLSTLSSAALTGPSGATGATGITGASGANSTVAGATGSVRYNPRVLTSTANSATPSLNTNDYDAMVITGQSATITSFTTNLTGSPVEGQKLIISITGTTTIAITWGASFESSTVTIPVATISTARLDIGFIYNATTSKWRCVATA